jgi:glutamate---cysteine ligase / carboxylate-amine ligase
MDFMEIAMNELFEFGIEEEYFIYRKKDGGPKPSMSTRFFDAAREALGDRVGPELLQSQIEVATVLCAKGAEARRQLKQFRRTLEAIATGYQLGILAAGTHPTGEWEAQRPTEENRYGRVAHDLQMIARRKMICGMHVHVAVPDRVSRVDLMVRSLPYVPLLLALSTSSPFWHSHRTGLMGYRQALHAELPRSGLPDLFRGEADYDAYVAALIDNRIIADASFIWWVVRPSSTYSTLELRVADSCTHVEDAVAIAALFRCLVRRLTRDPHLNRGLTPAARAIIEENKWRAQRYGIHGSLIDLAAGEARPIALVLSDVIALVAEDAAALGCEAELSALTTILDRGTSADQQLGIYRDALAGGASQPEALGSVVGWLADTTVH